MSQKILPNSLRQGFESDISLYSNKDYYIKLWKSCWSLRRFIYLTLQSSYRFGNKNALSRLRRKKNVLSFSKIWVKPYSNKVTTFPLIRAYPFRGLIWKYSPIRIKKSI